MSGLGKNLSFKETFSNVKYSDNSNQKFNDIEYKLNFYERKLGEITENNFDIYNGYYTVRTVFKKFAKIQDINENVKSKSNLINIKKDIDNSMKLVKKAINLEGTLNFKNSKFKTINNNRTENYLRTTVPYENTNSMNKDTRIETSSDSLMVDYLSPSYTNLNKSNLNKNLITKLPNITKSKFKQSEKVKNKLPLFKKDIFATEQTMNLKKVKFNLKNYSSFTNVLKSDCLVNNIALNKKPCKVLKDLFCSFKSEEEKIKTFSKEISKINKHLPRKNKGSIEENNLHDNTKDKNLIPKNKKVIFYNKNNKNHIITQEIFNKKIRKIFDKDKCPEMQINNEKRLKMLQIIDNCHSIKSIIDKKILDIKKNNSAN